jgi:hypothetical protein
MVMIDKINQIAQNANFIVNGYAFTCENEKVRVLNLNNMDKASVLDINGKVLMTSMDDIEISIIQRYWEKNKQFI